MTKKSIVVNYIGRKGGGPVYAFEMTKSLIEHGCTVYAIISKDIENLQKWQELSLAKLITLSSYSNKLNFITNTITMKLFRHRSLKKEFRNVCVDAVYVPMIHPWMTIINSIFNNSQKIITLHDPKPHSGEKLYKKMLIYKETKNADDIVLLSKKFIDYTEKQYGFSRERIHVIPHGTFDYYKKIESKTSSRYDSNKYNFLFFGRIENYKGLNILSQAYELLSSEYDNISLTVVGNGDFSDYINEYKKLKNFELVNRWIYDQEIGSFFSGDNIITVLPYTDATQSGVIPIAMEYGSLVIASDTGGLSEQIEDGKTGYLFEPGNPQALYEIMKYVIENYEKTSTIIENAKKYIRTLSWDNLGKKLLDIIK